MTVTPSWRTCVVASRSKVAELSAFHPSLRASAPLSEAEESAHASSRHRSPALARLRIEVAFADGLRTELDFRNRILGGGGVFQQLEDIEFFRQVRVDPDFGTLFWLNEVDFRPDMLHAQARSAASAVLNQDDR